MIKNARACREQFEINLSANKDFLAEKMLREYKCFKEGNLSNFYTINNADLMVMGENLSIRGSVTGEDISQIISFAKFMGIYGLESRQDNLPVPARKRFNLMRYAGGDRLRQPGMLKNDSIYQFASFSAGNFPGSAFDTLYSYFAGKVNRGLSDIYYILHNGRVISGCLATQYTEDIYITFLSTLPSARGYKLARSVVNHVISQRKGKGIILMCEDELVDFYKSLGFEIQQDIYLYTLREEKI